MNYLDQEDHESAYILYYEERSPIFNTTVINIHRCTMLTTALHNSPHLTLNYKERNQQAHFEDD